MRAVRKVSYNHKSEIRCTACPPSENIPGNHRMEHFPAAQREMAGIYGCPHPVSGPQACIFPFPGAFHLLLSGHPAVPRILPSGESHSRCSMSVSAWLLLFTYFLKFRFTPHRAPPHRWRPGGFHIWCWLHSLQRFPAHSEPYIFRLARWFHRFLL